MHELQSTGKYPSAHSVRVKSWGSFWLTCGHSHRSGFGVSSCAISNVWVVKTKKKILCELSRKIIGVLQYWKGKDFSKEIIHIKWPSNMCAYGRISYCKLPVVPHFLLSPIDNHPLPVLTILCLRNFLHTDCWAITT